MKDFHLRLPATSANLGPGFDSLAVALELYLDLRATRSETYSIVASGRNTDICSRLKRNLMLAVYENAVREAGKCAPPLAIELQNDIPIGIGLGSSAVARLMGLALANHFGDLCWSDQQILNKACDLEGHPDNAAACWLGGFSVTAMSDDKVEAVANDPPSSWIAIVVFENETLATSVARAALPTSYSLADATTNIQNVAVLTAAFHMGRLDLLRSAMNDRLHQPYREKICPLLRPLLPLAGNGSVMGVSLSGAGPAVLIITDINHRNEAILSIRSVLNEGTFQLITAPFKNVERCRTT